MLCTIEVDVSLYLAASVGVLWVGGWVGVVVVSMNKGPAQVLSALTLDFGSSDFGLTLFMTGKGKGKVLSVLLLSAKLCEI